MRVGLASTHSAASALLASMLSLDGAIDLIRQAEAPPMPQVLQGSYAPRVTLRHRDTSSPYKVARRRAKNKVARATRRKNRGK